MSKRRHYAAALLTGLVVLLASPVAFASTAEDNAAAELGFVAIAAGIGIGIAALGGALAQGRAGAAALDGIARNPGASGKIFTPMILCLALIESLVIYALIVAIMLLGKIPTITL